MKRRIFAVMLTLTTFACLFVGCGAETKSRKVDLNDYLAVEFEGRDGSGEAVANFDWDGMCLDILGDIDPATAEGQQMLWNIETGLNATCDRNDNLSNGDVITFTLILNEAYFESINVEITMSQTEFTVTGLSAPVKDNAFVVNEGTDNEQILVMKESVYYGIDFIQDDYHTGGVYLGEQNFDAIETDTLSWLTNLANKNVTTVTNYKWSDGSPRFTDGKDMLVCTSISTPELTKVLIKSDHYGSTEWLGFKYSYAISGAESKNGIVDYPDAVMVIKFLKPCLRYDGILTCTGCAYEFFYTEEAYENSFSGVGDGKCTVVLDELPSNIISELGTCVTDYEQLPAGAIEAIESIAESYVVKYLYAIDEHRVTDSQITGEVMLRNIYIETAPKNDQVSIYFNYFFPVEGTLENGETYALDEAVQLFGITDLKIQADGTITYDGIYDMHTAFSEFNTIENTFFENRKSLGYTYDELPTS